MIARSSPYGFDTYVGPVAGVVDMLPDGRSCSGATLVRNAMIARMMNDTISMVGAPGGVRDFGVDVRAWVGETVTERDREAKAQRLTVVFGRDPRIDTGSIRVKVSSALAGSAYSFSISVSARLTDATPISMVVGVSAVTVEILAQQGAT